MGSGARNPVLPGWMFLIAVDFRGRQEQNAAVHVLGDHPGGVPSISVPCDVGVSAGGVPNVPVL